MREGSRSTCLRLTQFFLLHTLALMLQTLGPNLALSLSRSRSKTNVSTRNQAQGSPATKRNKPGSSQQPFLAPSSPNTVRKQGRKAVPKNSTLPLSAGGPGLTRAAASATGSKWAGLLSLTKQGGGGGGGEEEEEEQQQQQQEQEQQPHTHTRSRRRVNTHSYLHSLRHACMLTL